MVVEAKESANASSKSGANVEFSLHLRKLVFLQGRLAAHSKVVLSLGAESKIERPLSTRVHVYKPMRIEWCTFYSKSALAARCYGPAAGLKMCSTELTNLMHDFFLPAACHTSRGSYLLCAEKRVNDTGACCLL